MTTDFRPSRTASAARTSVAMALLSGLLVTACVLNPSPTPTSPASPTPSPPPASQPPSAAASPSPTPAPEFTLELPTERDPRQVSVSVAPDVGAEDGEITDVYGFAEALGRRVVSGFRTDAGRCTASVVAAE